MTTQRSSPADIGLWGLASGDSSGPGSVLERKTRKRVRVAINSRNTRYSLDRAGCNTHLNHRHRLSTSTPTALNLMAYHTPHQQSSVEACHLPESRGTLAERISWGWLRYPGVLGDMVGRVMGLSTEPEPKDRFCCEM